LKLLYIKSQAKAFQRSDTQSETYKLFSFENQKEELGMVNKESWNFPEAAKNLVC
jgi:hypothetical protein